MLNMIPTLASAISSDMDKYLRRKRRSLIGFCVAIVFAITAYFAAVMAFLEWLKLTNDAFSSWLVIAILALSLSILVFSAVLLFGRYEKRKSKKHPSATSSAAMMAAAEIGKSGKALPVLAAIVSALVVYTRSNKSK